MIAKEKTMTWYLLILLVAVEICYFAYMVLDYREKKKAIKEGTIDIFGKAYKLQRINNWSAKMSCYECIHNDICRQLSHAGDSFDTLYHAENCIGFKDKSKIDRAILRQTPRKPKELKRKVANCYGDVGDYGACPNCGEYATNWEWSNTDVTFCRYCGQAIDWS